MQAPMLHAHPRTQAGEAPFDRLTARSGDEDRCFGRLRWVARYQPVRAQPPQRLRYRERRTAIRPVPLVGVGIVEVVPFVPGLALDDVAENRRAISSTGSSLTVSASRSSPVVTQHHRRGTQLPRRWHGGPGCDATGHSVGSCGGRHGPWHPGRRAMGRRHRARAWRTRAVRCAG